MSSSFLYHNLQSPGSVSHACLVTDAAGRASLLVLHDTHLSVCEVNSYGLDQRLSLKSPESILQMVYLPNNLLLLAEGGHCSLHSITSHAAAATQQHTAAFPLVAQAQLQAVAQDGYMNTQPYGCVMSSSVLSAAVGSETASLVAAAYQTGVLHLIKAAPDAAGSMALETKGIPYKHALLSCSFPDVSRVPLASVRVHSRVVAMSWLPATEQRLDLHGKSLLAVLHEFAPSSLPVVLHLDVLAVDWATGEAKPGPWSIRNVHPTTRLLQAFDGSAALPAGMLVISSRSILLCSCLAGAATEAAVARGVEGSAAVAGGAAAGLAVHKQQLLQWTLGGLPLSCVAVSSNCYIVGDDRAGLYVVHLPAVASTTAASWQHITANSTLTIPDVLCYAPLECNSSSSSNSAGQNASSTLMDDDQAQQQQQQQPPAGQGSHNLAGLLFIGSKSSSSQVMGLTTSALAAAHAEKQQQQPLLCPVLQSAFLPSLACAQAVTVLQDPTGSLPEQQLLVACGAGQRGKLALLRSGLGLAPLMLDGPSLPGDAVLFPIAEYPACTHCKQDTTQQQQQQHSLLGFSFPSAGVSEVLSLAGPTFRQLNFPGLQQSSSSLLLTGVPGGWLLQVTSERVWLLDRTPDRQLLHSWKPQGGTISLAAACGSLLAVACGDSLTCISASCCSGVLSPVGSCELLQQASALAVLRLSDGQHVVAAGLWVDNSLLLLRWPQDLQVMQQQQLAVCCSVELEDEQARSVAVLPVAGADVLLVGTNSGSVLVWQISHPQQQQQQTSMSSSSSNAQLLLLQHSRIIRISNASVSLQSMQLPAAVANFSTASSSSCSSSDTTVACIYAHAGAGAVIIPNLALLNARELLLHRQLQRVAPADRQLLYQKYEHIALTDCLLVSRVCGSEGCVTAAPIHHPDMPPHSLAWISASSRLCFGAVEPVHKLRWRARGLPGTPLAMAQHKQTNTLLLLLQAPSSSSSGAGGGTRTVQQQLVIMDAGSLAVLMTLALTEGHHYTSIAVLELPCTSQRQQGQQTSRQMAAAAAAGDGGDASAAAACGSNSSSSSSKCKPFIVLGSYANMDLSAVTGAGGSSSREQQQRQLFGARCDLATAGPQQMDHMQVGLISCFSITKSLGDPWHAQQRPEQPAAVSGDGAARQRLRYELQLHGIHPLPVTPASLCTVVPEVLQHCEQQQQQGATLTPTEADAAGSGGGAGATAECSAASAVASNVVCLAVGSEAGVTLFEVLIDDAGVGQQTRLQQHLAAAAQVEQMDIDDGQPGQARPLARAAATAKLPARQQQQQGSVLLSELTTCKASSGTVVTSLINTSNSKCGSLIATESLGSVTVLKALATPGGRVQLLPVGVDRSGLMAMDVTPATPHSCTGNSGSTDPVSSAAGGNTPNVVSAPAAAAVGGLETAARGTHEAMLVAMHPVGLLLLQRDLAAEQQHQLAAHQAAVQAWEAGGAARQELLGAQAAAARQLQLQQQQLFQAAVQPWLGDGEAAPWVGAGAAAVGAVRPQQWAAERQGHDGRGADRAGLAAAAAAAAGTGISAAAPVLTAAEVGVFDPGADAAPRLMPSAACAASPGTTLMCAAQLGLHVQRSWKHQQAATSSSSSRGGRGCCAGLHVPVWCFSASGAVSIAQMLPPHELAALQQLQQQLEKQQQQQHDLLQLHMQQRPAMLRPLQQLPLSSSFRNYQLHRHGAGPAAAAAAIVQTGLEETEEEYASDCIDGDLLWAVPDSAAEALPIPRSSSLVAAEGRLLQHLLLQSNL